jgi:aspartyl-tRNA(Asn)/glutamyl-tRNA(Gln) amidotransferase subunit B
MTHDTYIHTPTGPWEIVLGLEVHAQVASNAKLFSGAPVGFGDGPNANVSFVDAGFPGMLPVLNGFCVEQAVRTGLGLNAQINLKSSFDRKNYFYPDLPQGYQISQFKDPIVGEGVLNVERDDGSSFDVGIERIHLEQDAGKSIHDMDPRMTYVDLNRSGVALMEIVTKPDMRSSADAAAFLKKLRAIVRALGTCDGDMDKGNMRADVNVSVRRPGAPLGTRCEIKNVNSMRYVMMAIEYEARRQIEIIEDGGTVDQETRLFDVGTGETRTMRSKEDAHDYRYFPDPDLLPLEIEQAWVDEIRRTLPELPDQKKARFMQTYGLARYDASVLTSDSDLAAFFETAAAGVDGKIAANWTVNELLGRLAKDGTEITQSPVSAAQIADLVKLITTDVISSKIAKDVFDKMWAGEGMPSDIVEKHGLTQVTDTGAIETVVDAIIAANPDKAAEAREKPPLVGWFVGQVMKASGGKVNPQAVNAILKAKLGL